MNWFWDNILLKREDRIGMSAFLFLLILMLLIKWYMVVIYKPQSLNYNVDPFSKLEYTIVETAPEKKYSTHNSTWKANKNKSKTKKNYKLESNRRIKPVVLFDFDPNTLSVDSLKLLGLSKYAANNIEKYREKGGRFKNTKDLKKIYGIEDDLFLKVESFIKIKKSDLPLKINEIKKYDKPYKRPAIALQSIDINLADTTVLKSLKGIGSVYANRIVKFRNSLGGYFTIDQIRDVWGITDSLFVTIEPFLTLNDSLIIKKNINELSKEEFVKHPYINWKKAKAIYKYKKMHGDFKSMNDFEKLHGIEHAFVDTLKQYFVTK
jgi:DNA uptake protein ComE-like DNA-binding protein